MSPEALDLPRGTFQFELRSRTDGSPIKLVTLEQLRAEPAEVLAATEVHVWSTAPGSLRHYYGPWRVAVDALGARRGVTKDDVIDAYNATTVQR